MTTLKTGHKPAKSGKASSLVIFLHGYGADGKDLLGLADPLADYLPDTLFLAPDAPNTCKVNPAGFEWFPIPWMDGSSEVDAGIGLAKSASTLNTWLDQMQAEHGIAPDKTALVGFSQGTMMALQVAPRREAAFAGVVGFSGRLLSPDVLKDECKQKPPILLVHGDQDEMVPYSDLAKAEAGLTNAGFDVTTHTATGVGHGISPDGLGQALHFLQRVLDVNQS